MIITDIVRKKNGKQFDIYIDNILKFTIDMDLLIKFDIRENMNIDEEWLSRIENEIQYAKAYSYSIILLSIGDKTSGEIRKKLLIKNYNEVIIDRVICKLTNLEYLNDEKYIENWIKDKSKKPGMSKKAIYYKLLQKGLNKELLDEKFNEIEIDEFKLAFLAAEKKMKTINDEGKNIKGKLFSYLKSKGFNNYICFKVINELLKNDK